MTVQEFYNNIGGNYDEASIRFRDDERLKRFIKLFIQEPSLEELKNAIQSQDWEVAFRTAHTIKGTTANMSFTALQSKASALTEELRSREPLKNMFLYNEVEVQYQLVLDLAKELLK